jgi:peptidoglycan/LPS O-acetylase OafA/YrhL
MNSSATGSAQAAAQLPALTSLRFVAALGVLLLHYRDLLGALPDWVLRGVIGGQHGVTFFFVLSGFILSYRYQDWFGGGKVTAASYWAFARMRVARLYPIYIVGLLLDTPWHLIERAQAGQLMGQGPTWWASWLLNLVGLQAWVPAVPFAMYWNTPAWSVSAEFFFYAGFPFVCAWLARRRWTRGRLVAAFTATVLSGIALYAGVIYALNYGVRVEAQTQYITLVYNPLLRYSEFFAGCLLAQWFLHLRGPKAADPRAGLRLRNAAIVVSVVAIGARVWMPDYTGPSQWWWLLDVSVKYGVFILPFAALIGAVASGPTFLSPLLERPWLVLLGEASYSLYIIHWPVTTVIRQGWLGPLDKPVLHALLMLGTIAASVLCYRLIELPWRKRLRPAQTAAL